MGTGGLAHNPYHLFPPIDEVQPEWRPYILHGKAQSDVPQQDWLDYEIREHHVGAKMLISDEMTHEMVGLNDRWDKAFLATYCEGALSTFDQWDPERSEEHTSELQSLMRISYAV